MIALLIILVLTNAITLWLFLRAKYLNQKIHKNVHLLEQYLNIHAQLQRAGSATLEIKKLNENYLMYREPL